MPNNCTRCKEVKAYCKGMCALCYYATKRGYKTRREELKERNYVRGSHGVLTDRKGSAWIIDLEDFARCSIELWTNNGVGYAKSQRVGYLHRFLLPGCTSVDHINRNPLDCRKENLRDGSDGLNAMNKRKVKSASKFRGVSKMRNFWQARVSRKRVRSFLGTYRTERQAGIAIWEHAKKHHLEEFYIKP